MYDAQDLDYVEVSRIADCVNAMICPYCGGELKRITYYKKCIICECEFSLLYHRKVY